MGKVLEIGICKNKGYKISSVSMVEAIKHKGLINDRNYNKNTGIKKQITLIEIENIKYYNKITKVEIPSINFRRNIITEGIRLNELVGKEFNIGKVKVKAHDLCRPCKSLQDNLGQENIIKEFLQIAILKTFAIYRNSIKYSTKFK